MITTRSTVAGLLVLLSGGLPAGAEQTPSAPPPGAQSEQPFTPPPGGPERRAILDALRADVMDLTGPDLVFVVQHLKVSAGWAWIHAFPQSRDGSSRYEDVSALLHHQQSRWTVEHLGPPGGEACGEGPECDDEANAFADLSARFPCAPPGIFVPDGGALQLLPP
jgi:hypothetical protein